MNKSMSNNNDDLKAINNLSGEFDSKEDLYRVIFDNGNSIILLIDPANGAIVEGNKAAVKYYGYHKSKLVSMRIQDINILSEEQVKKEINRAQREKRNYFQFTHRLANNELREVEVYSFPIDLRSKKLLVSFIHDVSEKLKQKLMFDNLFIHSPYAVAILDKEQKIRNVNHNFTKLFLYPERDVIGQSINQIVSTDQSKEQIDTNLHLVYHGDIVKQEGIRKRKDGKLIEVEILGYPVISHQEVIGVYVIYIDIFRKKAYEKQLLLFRKILENNSEGVVITDTSGCIEWVNKAFTDITGYTTAEISGKKTSILKSGIHDAEFYKNMWEQLKTKSKWSNEIWNKNKRGDIYSEWLTIKGIINEKNEVTHYVGIFKDLSEKKKIDRRMCDLQQKDSLTGLYNRNYFIEKLDQRIQTNGRDTDKFAVIIINLASFKDMNDSLGHLIGDKILLKLSKRLQLMMNKENLLSRFSGDVFAILFKIKDMDVETFAKKLLISIRRPFTIDGTVIHVYANIGISTFPSHATEAETLIRYADIAMTRAKERMEDKICFYSVEMSKEIEMKFFLANHLVRAITKNELSIYYQPIFDITDGKIIGLEALLRWNNTKLGMISPNKFIPIAEKTGLIIEIGDWVFEHVCRQIKLWQNSKYLVVPVAVNISVKQLEQMGFSNKLIKIMKKYQIDPNLIELEITESVTSGDLPTIIKNLRRIKKLGLRISMDDFGTGFSSLGQLDLFELDKLKIDKVFIDDLVNVCRRQNLVRSIIAMAKTLNLVVVAEGIETTEQLLYLKKLGCHLGQGYLFSKPLPVEEIEVKLIKGNGIGHND
ncbi:MAG: hypothetical protein K0S76_66 [Herbinix sp.]|jgi:diguanylate cyclase (GGDEF)-like protein/PAS domain S-box-containing protein|nr:hypothetical protein [Herbinix sp.]